MSMSMEPDSPEADLHRECTRTLLNSCNEGHFEYYPIQPTSVRHDPKLSSWFEYFQQFVTDSSGAGMKTSLFRNDAIAKGPTRKAVTTFQCECRYKNLGDTPFIKFLIDEVESKLYLCHVPPMDDHKEPFCLTIEEIPIKIEKKQDGKHRQMEKSGESRVFLVRLPTIERAIDSDTGLSYDVGSYFLNPFDGSILYIYTCLKIPSVNIFIYWLKLKHGVPSPFDPRFELCIATSFEMVVLPGKVTPISEPSPIHLSNDHKKLVVRFRNSSAALKETKFLGQKYRNTIQNMIETLGMENTTYAGMAHNVPSYVVFGLNYDTRKIQLLMQFSPNYYLNDLHSDLLISKHLLPIVCDGFGQPPTGARSLVSQRSLMIGHFQKYTFFAIPLKEKLGILAVKSLAETLISEKHYLTPKKIFFPIDNLAFRQAFNQLPGNKRTKLTHVLSLFEKNILVAGNELIVLLAETAVKFLGTVRVKLGDQYKDYRKCAACGEQETKKRRSKNGKRVADFKVCGWYKDKGLHKLWWVRSCHYCSEECADVHWPKHKLEHEQKVDISFVDPKKKKKKVKKVKKVES